MAKSVVLGLIAAGCFIAFWASGQGAFMFAGMFSVGVLAGTRT